MPQPARGLAVRVERGGTSRRRCRPREQRLSVLVAVKAPTLALPPWWGGETHPYPPPMVGRGNPPWPSPPWWGGVGLRGRSPVRHQGQKSADLFGAGHPEAALSEEVG